ncbi:MFS transporter [Streptoalloteichus tenebrarius]|uniref:MFS transporter n=1 Tax=Streptoalloteichus tenebrarius (strain ATCC 17920 / DSM 40477 / JCM 4838 / CBS 697.72 / NBRC 16177 / NCIMB 11028 / NRRL B-12390 / A12253. 1 / ISP 5477) TaxID=1933 RepID=UPI0020A45B00|nr:MFS transporter [Streptoalloteichus tenebrarius]
MTVEPQVQPDIRQKDNPAIPDAGVAEGTTETRLSARPAVAVTGGALLVAGVVLAAANLRPAVTSLAAVLSEVTSALAVSDTWVSVVTAVPTLCFGLAAMGTPWLARKLGARGAIGLALALLMAGLVVRVLGGPSVLMAGTFVTSSAIAVCNVLIPVVVKESFPGRIGPVTGAYSASLTAGGAVAAAATVPLDHATGGWRWAVGAWALLALAALLVWLPSLRSARRTATTRSAPAEARRSLLRSPLAWVITVFFGLQSLIAYTVMGWLPNILRDVAGVDAATAGVLLAVVMVIGVPISFAAPPLAARYRSQSGMAVALVLSGLAGFLGLLLAPAFAPGLWILLIGIGMGIFPLALTLISLRARTGADTAALSAMAQSFGYLISATGPFLVGSLHGATGGWTASLVLLVAVLLVQIVLGWLAGRPRHV